MTRAQTEARIAARTFLFDLDGTLVDSDALHEQAFREALRTHRIDLLPSLDYREHMGMTTAAVFARLGVTSEEEAARLVTAKQAHYRESVEAGALRERAGAFRLIAGLVGRDAGVGVVTSASRASALIALDAIGVRSIVDFLVTGEDASRGKPHPDLYLEALLRSRSSPRETIAIEDAPAGVRSAREAGLRVVGVHDPRVRDLSDHYFPDLLSLGHALHVMTASA